MYSMANGVHVALTLCLFLRCGAADDLRLDNVPGPSQLGTSHGVADGGPSCHLLQATGAFSRRGPAKGDAISLKKKARRMRGSAPDG